MKPTSLPDIAELPDKALVYRCIGTLKSVFPRKSGEIKKGPNAGNPWSLQNLELVDASGYVLPVVMKDRQDEIPKGWQNREVMFEAHQGEKGWAGCYAFDDDYNNKVTRKLKLTATGQVSLVSGESAPAATAPPPPQAPKTPPEAVDTARAGTAAREQPATAGEKPTKEEVQKAQKEKVTAATKCAFQIANLQLLALNITETYTAPRFEKVAKRALTPDEKHAFAMNMTIELMRSQQQHRMPEHRLPDPKPATTAASKETPKMWAGKPWPPGAIPHPETGEPSDLAGNPFPQ